MLRRRHLVMVTIIFEVEGCRTRLSEIHLGENHVQGHVLVVFTEANDAIGVVNDMKLRKEFLNVNGRR